MEYEEFRRHLGKAGLTNIEFAEIVKLNRNTLSNFRRYGVPKYWAIIAVLMGVMADNAIDFKGPMSRIKIDMKKARAGSLKGEPIAHLAKGVVIDDNGPEVVA